MLFTSLLRAWRRRRGDQGLALPTVIGISLVMLIMVAGSLTVAAGGLKRTDTDEDWNAAIAAAYAGVQEYQSRLANDSTYSKYGNPTSTFTLGPTGKTTLVAPVVVNPAFGIGGTWATVPGSDGQSKFRYEVDNSKYQSTGKLRLRSTGMVGSSVRSLVADLNQVGFVNFLYLTTYEVQDPQFTGKDDCEAYAYGAAARDVNDCGIIQFGRDKNNPDVFDGPVHSNDSLFVCNGDFQAPVTSSSTGTKTSPYPPVTMMCTGTTTPTISYAKPIDIPPSNAGDRNQTFSDNVDNPKEGCLYTGPTTIKFFMQGSVAKMNVVSPYTLVTNPKAGETSGKSEAYCGDIAAMHTAAGSTVDALDANLIYVQNVPDKSSGNVNGWTTSSTPSGFSCLNRAGMGGWKFGATQYPLEVGTKAGKNPDYVLESSPLGSSSKAEAYGCRSGDVFVSGTVGSALTVSAENYVYIMSDILYADWTTTQEDMIGLVGDKGVIVWNPYGEYCSSTRKSGTECNGWSSGSLQPSQDDRTIYAAIMSVTHTFQVQNYSRMPRGTLSVTGSIAQKFRGPVGQGSNGYVKAYHHDPRFVSTAPPKFITPTSTTYEVNQYAAVPAAFKPDGSVAP